MRAALSFCRKKGSHLPNRLNTRKREKAQLKCSGEDASAALDGVGQSELERTREGRTRSADRQTRCAGLTGRRHCVCTHSPTRRPVECKFTCPVSIRVVAVYMSKPLLRRFFAASSLHFAASPPCPLAGHSRRASRDSQLHTSLYRKSEREYHLPSCRCASSLN